VFRQSSFAFPIASEILTVLRHRGYEGPADVIPLGIDLNLYRPTPEAERLAGSLRRRDDELLIGFVGRLVEVKGLPTLLRAAALLTDLPWRLILAGSGTIPSDARGSRE
jgi:L-malate glycosyltransferase